MYAITAAFSMHTKIKKKGLPFKLFLNKVLSKMRPPIFLHTSITFGWNFRLYTFIFTILTSLIVKFTTFIFEIIYVTSRPKEKRETT